MEVKRVSDVKNFRYYLIGAVFLIINFFRHRIMGYTTPRTFSIDEIERSVDYDFDVVNAWLKRLSRFEDSKGVKGKTVLELGPGPDLGIGLILLAMGAKQYIALDIHKLATSAPSKLYEKIFERIAIEFPKADLEYLKTQLDRCLEGKESDLRYVVDEEFCVKSVKEKVDIVFSQAAFEHFTDVERTILELEHVVKEGSLFVAEIDMSTHTRWIRDKDPLNIYRYSDWFWRLCRFQGSPNRVRACEYKSILEKRGWKKVGVEPEGGVELEYLKQIQPSLRRRFRNLEPQEMCLLSIFLTAQKA